MKFFLAILVKKKAFHKNKQKWTFRISKHNEHQKINCEKVCYKIIQLKHALLKKSRIRNREREGVREIKY